MPRVCAWLLAAMLTYPAAQRRGKKSRRKRIFSAGIGRRMFVDPHGAVAACDQVLLRVGRCPITS